MAHAEQLSNKELGALAAELGSYLANPSGFGLTSLTDVRIAETFEVWTLGLDTIVYATQKGIDIARVACPSCHFHHQLLLEGEPRAFARSHREITSCLAQWLIDGVFVSGLAAHIDEAIGFLDQRDSSDRLVRLLVVPSYQLHALWLIGKEATAGIVVADAPPEFTVFGSQTFLSSKEFLQDLSLLTPCLGVLLSNC
jgi:hypothetical protein